MKKLLKLNSTSGHGKKDYLLLVTEREIDMLKKVLAYAKVKTLKDSEEVIKNTLTSFRRELTKIN